jgi:phosphatidylinositol kinase/protein kinase (PI-3  family)
VEQFEEEVNYLQVENARLKNQVATMEESVSKLQTLEETVSTLQSLQGNSVTALEQQLQESKNILASMKINTQGQILQNLIGVLLATDVDQNMLLSDAEIQQLISNLEQVENIQLDENLIKSTIIEQGRSVAAVMEIARNVMSNESAMFTYLEKQPPPDGTTTPQNIFSPM